MIDPGRTEGGDREQPVRLDQLAIGAPGRGGGDPHARDLVADPRQPQQAVLDRRARDPDAGEHREAEHGDREHAGERAPDPRPRGVRRQQDAEQHAGGEIGRAHV
jgi:hypothetical protein